MLCLRNFTQYVPEELANGPGVYFQDEEGRDWYAYRPLFDDNALKILFDERHDNRIVSANMEHWFMCPDRLSIAEVDVASVPENFKPDSNWSFIDGKIVQPKTFKEEAVREVRNYLLYKTDVMMIADYTIADEFLSETQKEELRQWRLALKRFPTQSSFPDIPFVATPKWIIECAVIHGFQLEAFEPIKHFCPFQTQE